MIGIISDTHDNVPNILKAIEIFKKNNVEFVIHCGDIISPGTVKFFEGVRMKFIFGNCDGDRVLIEEKIKEHGWELHGSVMELKINDKTIGVVHGNNPLIWDKMINKDYDYLIHGHTHTPEDRKLGNMRILCPGGHFLGDGNETNKVIILNLDNDKALFVDVI
jgi:putative phosphoesterase